MNYHDEYKYYINKIKIKLHDSKYKNEIIKFCDDKYEEYKRNYHYPLIWQHNFPYNICEIIKSLTNKKKFYEAYVLTDLIETFKHDYISLLPILMRMMEDKNKQYYSLKLFDKIFDVYAKNITNKYEWFIELFDQILLNVFKENIFNKIISIIRKKNIIKYLTLNECESIKEKIIHNDKFDYYMRSHIIHILSHVRSYNVKYSDIFIKCYK